MKVVTIAGTRPELIKLSEIIKKLDKYTDHVFIHTGQNYDYELGEIFYKDLGLRKPDIQYDVTSGSISLANTIGNIFLEVEQTLLQLKPDAVVILGDTNSALAGIIVKRLKIPLFHLEAGNRSFDDNVPEEINRRILDHASDVNMVYTDIQRLHLLGEGIAKDRIFIMGSPMKEIFNRHIDKIRQSEILKTLSLTKNEYFLVSLHRDENVEIDKNLDEILATLKEIAIRYEMPVIVSTHPRLRGKIDTKGWDKLNIGFMKPFGFLDYNHLQMNAKCVISDSGTLAEESALLGFPAVTIRNAFERPEAIDAASILMSGVNQESILNCIEIAQSPTTVPSDYHSDNCSDRVLKTVLSYTPYINRYVWHRGY